MTQAYIVAEVDVSDADAYRAYTAQVPGCLAPFEGTFLVRGGSAAGLEGDLPAGRIVILVFPSLAQASGFWDSPAYRAIVPIRTANATSRVFMVEGVTG